MIASDGPPTCFESRVTNQEVGPMQVSRAVLFHRGSFAEIPPPPVRRPGAAVAAARYLVRTPVHVGDDGRPVLGRASVCWLEPVAGSSIAQAPIVVDSEAAFSSATTSESHMRQGVIVLLVAALFPDSSSASMWNRAYGRELSGEEQRDIRVNLAGFMSILLDWKGESA